MYLRLPQTTSSSLSSHGLSTGPILPQGPVAYEGMSHTHTHTHTPPCTIWILFHTCLRTSEPIFQVSFTNPAGAASFEICETHLIPHLIVRAYPPFLYSNFLTYSFPIHLYSMKPCKPLQIWEVVRCLMNKFKCIYKFKAILYRDTTAVQSS